MIKIIVDEGFKRKYQKAIKNNVSLKAKFQHRLRLFSEDPYNPTLKTHKLSGKLKDLSSFRIDYHTRIIFKFIDKNSVQLIDIGSHDEVY